MKSIDFNDFQVGQSASVSTFFSKEEVEAFSLVSIDRNPIHLNAKYANKTFFKKPIAQGLLVTSVLGGLLGSDLPGPGTILLGQSMKYYKPVYVGEEIKARVEIKSIDRGKRILIFDCCIFKEENIVVIKGEMTVMYKGYFFNE